MYKDFTVRIKIQKTARDGGKTKTKTRHFVLESNTQFCIRNLLSETYSNNFTLNKT